MRFQERLQVLPQGLIIAAGPIQVSGALRGRGKLQGLGEERHQVAFGIGHGITPNWSPLDSARSRGTKRQELSELWCRPRARHPALSARNSQARAKAHWRSAFLAEMPTAAAASSNVRPAKNRS